MAEMEDGQRITAIYRAIGEFAVSFQMLESRIRELGWLLLNPGREAWPPTELRDLSNYALLNRVRTLYVDTIGTFIGSGVDEYCQSFVFTIDEAHKVRRIRNSLLHSAFVELKAGGEVVDVLRTNTNLVFDEDGTTRVDTEVLSSAGVSARLATLARVYVAVNWHHAQLIHWAPFEPKPRVDACGLAFHRDGLPFPPAL